MCQNADKSIIKRILRPILYALVRLAPLWGFESGRQLPATIPARRPRDRSPRPEAT